MRGFVWYTSLWRDWRAASAASTSSSDEEEEQNEPNSTNAWPFMRPVRRVNMGWWKWKGAQRETSSSQEMDLGRLRMKRIRLGSPFTYYMRGCFDSYLFHLWKCIHLLIGSIGKGGKWRVVGDSYSFRRGVVWSGVWMVCGVIGCILIIHFTELLIIHIIELLIIHIIWSFIIIPLITITKHFLANKRVPSHKVLVQFPQQNRRVLSRRQVHDYDATILFRLRLLRVESCLRSV